MLDTLVGIGIPTLCHPLSLCPFLLEGGTALSSTAENLPCSTCRRKLCPDCVMCAVYCSRNGPSACRSSPERRKELRGWRRHQVGGPPLSPGALRRWILSSLWGGKPVPGTRWAVRGGFSFVHPISCRVGYMVFMDSEGSTLMSPFSGNSQCILTVCFFTHSISR